MAEESPHKHAIESDERGITINKPLAWTILVSIISAVWWGGETVTSLRESVGSISRNIEVSAAKLEQQDDRIRSLESRAARQDEALSNLVRSIEEIKSAQSETNDLLRQIYQMRGISK